jgi:hypothetical protein
MFTTTFLPKKLHTYTKAKVDGRWFEVSHFDDQRSSTWLVWLRADHGVGSGFVDVLNVEEWEFTPNW